MLKKFFCFLFLFIITRNFLSAQFHSFYGPFQPVTELVCPFDDNKIIKSSKDYYFYYTKDNQPFGEIDSSVSCINLTSSFSSIVKITGQQILPKRPLFIRDYGVRKNRERLLSNQLYSFSFMSVHAANTAFNNESPQSYGINFWEHAGENITDTVTYQTSSFLDQGTTRYISAEYCHVTSKSERQEFLGSVYAIYFDSTLTQIPDISFFSYAATSTEFNLVDKEEYIIPITGNEDKINIPAMKLFQTEWPDVHLVLHTQDGYPAADNFSYKTIRLQPNPDKQKDINIQIEYGGIHFQEFTGLMTEHPEGEDSILHNVYLELLNDNLCVGFIEFVFNPPLSFKYSGGNIDFTDKASCMLVNQGSEFRINEKTKVKYGEKGKGMLALDGGKIYLEEGADFLFDGILVLKNRPDHHLYIDKKGRLVFSEDAEIWALEGHYLKIYAFPWQVNFEKLDPEYRRKIILISPHTDPSDPLFIYPTPAGNGDRIFIGDTTEKEEIFILNSQGLIVSKQLYDSMAGINLSGLADGVYFLRSGNRTGRFVKIQ